MVTTDYFRSSGLGSMEAERYFQIPEIKKEVNSSDSVSFRGRNCAETSTFLEFLVLKRFEPDVDPDPIFIFAKINNCQKNKLFQCLSFVVHHMTSIFVFRKRNGHYLLVISADHPTSLYYIETTRLPIHISNEVSYLTQLVLPRCHILHFTHRSRTLYV